jgi:peptide/nickel transport system ATP-binding protein
LVGESGCGKSLLALSLFGLLPKNAIVSGSAIYDNRKDLLTLSEASMNQLRGKRLVLIPQDPAGHLNPTLTVGYQFKESLKQNLGVKGKKAKGIAHELLRQVGFLDPKTICKRYPHQLSGGMAQRVLLAIGLIGEPEVVIADEPTRGLDLESQNQFLEQIHDLYRNSALLIITHQLEAARECDWLLVMYGGEIVEEGPSGQVLKQPQHPYTRGLLNAHPDKGMHPIPGQPFSFSEMISGCHFSPRCLQVTDICRSARPFPQIARNSVIRCHHAGR